MAGIRKKDGRGSLCTPAIRQSLGGNMFTACNPFVRCDDRPADVIASDSDFNTNL